MMRCARDIIFWLGMSKEIKQIANNCITCQNLKPNNQKECLKQHNEGLYPWEKCDVDLFEVNGKMYLIIFRFFLKLMFKPKLPPNKSYIALKSILLTMVFLKLLYLTVARNLFLTILECFRAVVPNRRSAKYLIFCQDNFNMES